MNELIILIGNHIKEKRILMNKTQKELAQSSGVSLMTLRRAENGDVCSVETLGLIMEVFGELDLLKSVFKKNISSLYENEASKAMRVKRSKVKTKISAWKWGDEKDE